MRTAFKSLLVVSIAAALTVGCSDSNDSPANETSAPGPNAGENPTVLTKFDGTYLSACAVSDPDDESEGSDVVSTTISGDTGSVRVFDYTDTACAVPASPAEYVSEVSIAYPGGTVETARGTADFINVTIESVTVDGQPPTTDEQTQLTNTGFYNSLFDIIVLDGSSLYFGDTDGELDGETAETRPNTLDPDPAIRQ